MLQWMNEVQSFYNGKFSSCCCSRFFPFLFYIILFCMWLIWIFFASLFFCGVLPVNNEQSCNNIKVRKKKLAPECMQYNVLKMKYVENFYQKCFGLFNC